MTLIASLMQAEDPEMHLEFELMVVAQNLTYDLRASFLLHFSYFFLSRLKRLSSIWNAS